MKTKKINLIIFIFLIILFNACSAKKAESDEMNKTSNHSKTYSVYVLKSKAVGNELRLPAQLKAFESINIFPKLTGYIKNIYVDIGTEVKRGQIIMELEAPEVEQNNLAAHEKYLKALATFNASKDNYYRLLNTSKTVGAVSPNDLEASHSKLQSDSAFCNSEKAYWMSMQSMNEYLIVKAPFDGIITQRNIHQGALVTMGSKMDSKPLLELQQINKLRLEVQVPESYVTQLQENNKITFLVDAIPGKYFSGIISRQAHALDEKFRSETVEIDVINSDKHLMPGMYAEVLLPLQGHSNAILAPQSAVITSTERKYVIKVNHQKADLIDVRTGNEDKGIIEIFGNVFEGDTIVEKASEDIVQDQSILVSK